MKLQAHEKYAVYIAGGLIVPIFVLIAANVLELREFVNLIVSGLVAGTGGVIAWGFKDRIKTNATSNGTSDRQVQKSLARQKAEEHEKMRHSKMLEVGDLDEFVFDIKRGSKIVGKASSGGLFSIWFLTEASRRSFHNDNDFNPIDGRENVYSCEVTFEAPRTGRFYIIMVNEDSKDITLNVDMKVVYA